MARKIIIWAACILILGSCSLRKNNNNRTTYPKVAKKPSFKKIGYINDSLRVFAEIDVWKNGVSVGEIVGVALIGNELFFCRC